MIEVSPEVCNFWHFNFGLAMLNTHGHCKYQRVHVNSSDSLNPQLRLLVEAETRLVNETGLNV